MKYSFLFLILIFAGLLLISGCSINDFNPLNSSLFSRQQPTPQHVDFSNLINAPSQATSGEKTLPEAQTTQNNNISDNSRENAPVQQFDLAGVLPSNQQKKPQKSQHSLSNTPVIALASAENLETVDSDNDSDTSLSTTDDNSPYHVSHQQLLATLLHSPNNSNQKLHRILNSALVYHKKNAASEAIIAQKAAETAVIKRSAWPDIRPGISHQLDQSTRAEINLNYTLFDFGLHNERVTQGELGEKQAQLQQQLDQRKLLAETLNQLAEIAELREQLTLNRSILGNIQQLYQTSLTREKSGIDSYSGTMLLELKIAELQSAISALEKEQNLKYTLLARKLAQPIRIEDIPTLSQIQNSLQENLASQIKQTPQVQMAELLVQAAATDVNTSKKQYLPKLVLSASGYTDENGRVDSTIGLSLKASTSLFSGSAATEVEEAKLNASQRKYQQTRHDVQTELQRLQLEKARLQQNYQILNALQQKSHAAIKLFKARFKAAKVAVSDGISPYNTLLNTQQKMQQSLVEIIAITAGQFLYTHVQAGQNPVLTSANVNSPSIR